MKQLIFSILCLVTLLVSAQNTVSGTMLHDNVERIHKIYVPSSYSKDKPAPLLLLIHGYSEPAGWILEYTKFQPLAEKYGFIIACPEGKINKAKVPSWDFQSTNDKGGLKDIDYISSFIDKLVTDYSINEKKIYITGFSQGGFMSYIAGCSLSKKIAAIAPVSGLMPSSDVFKCNMVHSTPAIIINGDNDTAVAYNGNQFGKSVEATLNFLADFNKCDKTPVITSIKDQNPDDDQTIEKYAYLNGENNTQVVHYKVIGGTHLWPGREGNNSFEATPAIWEFLSQFKLE